MEDKEVGEKVISDLDLVEVIILDCKLTRSKTLTYSGQNKLCEELDLKLLDSTNCIIHISNFQNKGM